jgi:hypothetical protein
MKKVIQFAVMSLCFSGMGFATEISSPSNATGRSQSADSNAGGMSKDRSGAVPTTGSGKNTDIRDGSIMPGGPGVAENGMGLSRSAQINGTVESVDQTGNRVRVRDAQGNVQEYTVNDKSEFMNNQKKSKFSDIKTGDSVTFDLDKDNQSIKKFKTNPRK